MRNGPSAFLVDTNVLVYAYDTTEGEKQDRAIEVLELLSSYELGSLSVQVLGEFFTVVTRRIPQPLTESEAERALIRYVRSWPVYDLTELIVLEAIRGLQRYQMSYWDSLIWATARLNDVHNVFSEDFNDGALLEGVRFLNPFAETFDPASLGTSHFR